MNSGESAWIGSFLVPLIGPRSSIGSPVTFMIRPRVPGPTGIMIGAPVSTAGWPRTRPSVPVQFVLDRQRERFFDVKHTIHSNASYNIFSQMLLAKTSVPLASRLPCEYFARTATSKTSLLPPLSVSRALRMGGSASRLSNFTVKTMLAMILEIPGFSAGSRSLL
jgi:hypothetical protein